MWFGNQKPRDRARQELEDNERERFMLQKNMMHDQHRLAYIDARTAQLAKAFPELVQSPVIYPSAKRDGVMIPELNEVPDVPRAAPLQKHRTVQPSETLASIAREINSSVDLLRALNVMSPVQDVYPGQLLRLPS